MSKKYKDFILFASFIAVVFSEKLALAQEATGQPPAPSFSEVFSKMMPMFGIVFLIFYFMVVRPQQKKLLAQETLMKNLKKGDAVVTTGGIHGKISSVEDSVIVMEVSKDVKLRIDKQCILRSDSEKKISA